MNPVEFTIFGMATWRLASMFVRERGPFDIFVRVREIAGITHDPEKEVLEIPDNLLAGILSCVWCCSMWVALCWTVFFLITPLLATKIATIFAISTAAILVDRWTGN